MTTDTPLQMKFQVHFATEGKGARKTMRVGPDSNQERLGRIPRVSKLMALAHKFDGLIAEGIVKDQADLARLGNVTRARMTQILGLLQLAPDIQEDLLHLPRIVEGRDPIVLRDLFPICQELDWAKQRAMWKRLK